MHQRGHRAEKSGAVTGDVVAADGRAGWGDLVDALPALVWHVDAAGVCRRVNAPWSRFTGEDGSAVCAAGWLDWVHPADRDRLPPLFADALTGEAAAVDVRLRRHDGAYRWFAVRASRAAGDGWALVAVDVHDRRTTAAAGEEARARLQRLLHVVPVAICEFELAPDGTWSMPYASPHVEDIYGLPAELLRDDFSPAFRLVHPDDSARLAETIAESARSLTTWQDEFRLVRPDGSECWVEGRSIPRRLEDGRVHWDGYIADATRRKHAEADARRWHAAFERAGIGIALADARTNCFVAVNAAYARLRGLDRHELVGQPLKSAYGDNFLTEIMPKIREADRTGHVVFEAHTLRRGGPPVPVLVDLTVLHDQAGQPVSRVAFVVDLTSRKAAEATAHLWARAFEQADVAISLANPRGEFAAVNPAFARQRGYTPDELAGQSIDVVLPDEERPRVWAGIAANLDHRVAESVHRRKDGTTFPVLADVTAIRNEQGAMIARVGFFQELTAQKDAEAVQRRSEEQLQQLLAELEQRVEERTAQLRETNAELEAFSYSVSHDLRAPLRGIDGWSLALLEDCGDALGDEGRSHLQRVRAETRRMDALIDDLLRFSRVGRAPLTRVRIDLTPLVQQVADRLLEAHPDRRLEFRIAPGLTAEADPRLLEVVFTNLLENAVKFTSRRDLAVIEVGALDDGTPGFFVRDNGAGFDMTDASALFGPFKRLHRASEYPGTGIGLATVQRIVHRHGGRVWAAAAPDRGATFSFTLGSPS